MSEPYAKQINNSRKGDLGSLKEKGITFNGKVVFGIGIIMIAAAISTILAMMSSQSPEILLFTKLVGKPDFSDTWLSGISSSSISWEYK